MPESVPVVLSLGGNRGDVPAQFAWAITRLTAAGLSRTHCSRAYRTTPVACPPDTTDFWNAALIGDWPHHDPRQLLAICKSLEIAAGRPGQHDRGDSRPLDLDLILFGQLALRSPTLTLPHPEAHRRLFVLIPLAEIAPQLIFPGIADATVAQMLARATAGDPDEAAQIHAQKTVAFWPNH